MKIVGLYPRKSKIGQVLDRIRALFKVFGEKSMDRLLKWAKIQGNYWGNLNFIPAMVVRALS